jgi:hypothetical protein
MRPKPVNADDAASPISARPTLGALSSTRLTATLDGKGVDDDDI